MLLMALEAAEKLTGRPIHANVYGPEEWPEMQLDPVIRAILEGPMLELHLAEDADHKNDQPRDNGPSEGHPT
jgi:hypothetical protein